VAIIASALCLAGSARAGDATEDDLIKQGVESRRRRDDAGALASFQKAYELHHSPRAAAQIGLAEFALGRWVDAEGHLEEAVSASSDPWIAKNGAVVRDALSRVQGHLGDLEIMGSPAGAEIVIEGQVRGRLPLGKPIRTPLGECRFEVRASGYLSLGRTVQITAEQLTRETLNLSPVAPPASNAVGTTHDGSAPKPVPGGEHPPADPIRSPEVARRSGLQTAGIALGAAGVLSVGLGAVLGLKAKSLGEANSNAPMFDATADERGHTYATLQYVAYGLGAALVATGVIMYLRSRPRHSGGELGVAIVPTALNGGGMLVSGRF
jgi:hypothetical protein